MPNFIDIFRQRGNISFWGMRNVAISLLPSDKMELDKLYNMKKEVYTQLRSLGFIYITMDLKGYRTGAMNETL